MIVRLADNIISPLGATTAENLRAVAAGCSALAVHSCWGMSESFTASLFEEAQEFDSLLLRSVSAALRESGIDATSPRVGLVIASTKGRVTELETAGASATLKDKDGRVVISADDVPEAERLGVSAQSLACALGNPNRPIVVSNACISGLSAIIVAMRLLESGVYDSVIVTGCDVQSKFIVSGFQSFKAMSPDECRPFDEDRCGLNLGEAVATLILARNEQPSAGQWMAVRGAIRNDACHISNPSKTAEGSMRAIMSVMEGEESDALACISAHGTATLYNDEMEAVAIDRAGLASVPVFSLKGYYGHTMGAAGILETIITMHAVDEGWVPATRGYAESGVSRDLMLSSEHRPTQKHAFLKLLSGFGGCNAAVLFRKNMPGQ